MDLLDNKLIDEMVKQQMRQEKFDPPRDAKAPEKSKTIGPKTALLMGSLADSASTYAFLKRGGKEANPALQYFNSKPWSVIPTAAAGAAGYNALHGLIKRKSPKIADTLAGLLGGYHTALAGSNMQPNRGTGSYEKVVRDLQLTRRK